MLELILPQNNNCLLPHYCCSKFCFRWILWLCQLFAWSGTDQSPPFTNCFLLMTISRWGLGFLSRQYFPIFSFFSSSFLRSHIRLRAMFQFFASAVEGREKLLFRRRNLSSASTKCILIYQCASLLRADKSFKCGSGAATVLCSIIDRSNLHPSKAAAARTEQTYSRGIECFSLNAQIW